MDPATLAGTAVSLLVGYLSRHRDELVDRVGDAATNQLAKLYGWVKDHLHREPRAGAILDGLEQEPADARRQGAVEFALTQLIDRDAALAQQLAELMAAVGDESKAATTQITDSGAVALGGDVRLAGTYVAGRDLTFGQASSPTNDTSPPAQNPAPGQQ